MKKLILVDALGIVYRSFHAIRELTTSDGRPVNAVFGFIRKMDEIRRTWAPTHLCVVFDGGLPRERLDLLGTYKAQRIPMPDALRAQFPAIEEYLDAAGIFRVRMDGQEADDVIASAAAWAETEAEAVYCASSDKDLFQLVNDRVKLLQLSGGELMGVAEVVAKTGVEPARIVEWLAMVGDSSDNIGGVPGIGPKTAARLLGAYRTLGELRDHLAELPPGKVRESLESHWDLLHRNIKLVRLRRDIPLGWTWPDLAVKSADTGRLLSLFDKLEFSKMAAEIRSPSLF